MHLLYFSYPQEIWAQFVEWGKKVLSPYSPQWSVYFSILLLQIAGKHPVVSVSIIDIYRCQNWRTLTSTVSVLGWILPLQSPLPWLIEWVCRDQNSAVYVCSSAECGVYVIRDCAVCREHMLAARLSITAFQPHAHTLHSAGYLLRIPGFSFQWLIQAMLDIVKFWWCQNLRSS